jgi:hypothetical protein
MLGCAILDMLRKYLALVAADGAEAHRKANPVERWRLANGITIDRTFAGLPCLSNIDIG